jgi:hypothetical protein
VTLGYVNLPSFIKKAHPIPSASYVKMDGKMVMCVHFDEILSKITPLLTLEIPELPLYNCFFFKKNQG